MFLKIYMPLQDEWDFPLVLQPIQSQKAKKVGLVYDIVGRSFWGRSHYVSCFVVNTNTPSRRKAVFFYNGQSWSVEGTEKGYSHWESGGISALLGGRNVSLPAAYKGFKTITIFYALHGGTSAWEWFSNYQRTQLSSTLGIQLSNDFQHLVSSQPVLNRDGFLRIPVQQMQWLSVNAKKGICHFEYAMEAVLHREETVIEQVNPTILVLDADGKDDQQDKVNMHLNYYRMFPSDYRITVLVKDGTLFAYPACLIEPENNLKSWTIKWWHLNQPAEDTTHIPNSYVTVEVTQIVDSLYHDVKGRWSVQLG
uniref:Uncharacterized protein n=1 Tax=Moniliophthora roreri TaxID=221103 RepID=A0A0W0GED6_MONRR